MRAFSHDAINRHLRGNRVTPRTLWNAVAGDVIATPPDGDGKTKLEHVRDMLTNVAHQKRLPFQAVLMDSWYAAKDLMLFVE